MHWPDLNADEQIDYFMQMDDRCLQLILQGLSATEQALLLKFYNCSALKERFFSQLSQRAALMLQDELAYLGEPNQTALQDIHKKSSQIVQSLLLRGDIVL